MVKRLINSAVVWSWIFNGLRLASGLILLPLVLHKLSAADLGMYYVLLSLAALAPVMDMGLGPTIGRFVNYAMGGARDIQAHGISKSEGIGAPNYDLLWELLLTMRVLYRYLTVAAFIIMGVWGTYVVELRIHETSSPLIARWAWAVMLAATLLNMYSNWWCVYLRGMNQVLMATRISVWVIVARLAVAAGLFCAGAGLLSLPIAMLLSDWLQRRLARVLCLALLSGHLQPKTFDLKKNLRILWPNSWRLGVQFISGYLTVNANTAICVYSFGLVANAQYGLSVQLMNIAVGMAAVWITIKWPLIGQYRARHNHAAIRHIIWQRLWFQNLTFLFLAAAIILFGPMLLRWAGSSKEM
ncbi:MAG: lipopolysaccharide biosynthesis protein, partial [Limisphaerales bacterium]